MTPRVTIGLPIYKRLHYLPNVLKIVRAQDYSEIDLLVSDNGLHGAALRHLVDRSYDRPYTFRQNPAIVSISKHFNQLVDEASGEYFVLLADDDEITPNYVSDLVARLEQHPEASVAVSVQETIDEAGMTIRTSKKPMPPLLSGFEFIRRAWGTCDFEYESFSTLLARTQKLRACGGYPDFFKGHHNDDALLIKACIDSYVVLSNECSYRKRFDEASHGYAAPIEELALGIRDFLKFLDRDSIIEEYARCHPSEWRQLRAVLIEMAWKTYFFRWADMYRKRMSTLTWVKAAYALPFIPAYYKEATRIVAAAPIAALWDGVRKHAPWVYHLYHALKARRPWTQAR
jgi:glycosyltransferase involved in cell wall biosynthesis